MSALVNALYWVSFALAVGITVYAWRTFEALEDSNVRWAVVSAAAAAVIFGVHHLGEAYLGEIPYGQTISESVEILAILGLGAAMLHLHSYAVDEMDVEMSAD